MPPEVPPSNALGTGRPAADKSGENFLYVFKAALDGPLAPPTGHEPRGLARALGRRLSCRARRLARNAEGPGPPRTTDPELVG
ncbi:hypothetical protein GCM10009557_13940 [Virgisporangium ochraceum]|uniref:Uncharacterized protein n=1 Tax=Virgisporangium ochraceum TaxID=65505 RepID=A0A8J3ZY04_9ACTN|nr:hypothetical protein [Virgisporangium ochraceum]GIJ71268.1 hypothetical protein Voc01_061850 [Virgisporangium ochraceum]